MKLIEFIKAKLKIETVERSKIFQDGYQIYYDGQYVGNIQDMN